MAPKRRVTRANPGGSTASGTRAGRPSRNRQEPTVNPRTETTPVENNQDSPAPNAGLPRTAAELEQLITERISNAMANARNVQNGPPLVEAETVGARHGSTSNMNPEEPRRICSYKDFVNCRPRNFYGNEGVVGLTRWIERIESVFEICYCSEGSKVRFAACTFLDGALTWWNDHVKTLGVTIANSMTWEDMKMLLIEEYCPREEVQALEHELWNLKMKGSDIKAYTTRFNDLALLCQGMVTPESRKVERYLWGLAPQIKGMVLSSRPTTYLSAKRLALQLIKNEIDQGTMVAKAEPPKVNNNNSKRKFNGGNQRPPKKQ